MATQPKTLVTLDDYLEAERRADYKSEYYDGEIFAMSGGTHDHSRLSARLTMIFGRLFDSCEIFDSNLKLYLEQTRQCVYPDSMVLCGQPEFLDNRKDVILNPTLVAEVLSASTETYDKRIKAFLYRSIPSLKDCLLVSQDRPLHRTLLPSIERFLADQTIRRPLRNYSVDGLRRRTLDRRNIPEHPLIR